MPLLAEQVLVECPPSTLEEILSHRPLSWMTPLLRLAGDAGEEAGLALLGRSAEARPAAGGPPAHVLEAGEVDYGDAGFRVPLRWRTSAYRALFSRFDGALEVRSLSGRTVLSLEGGFVGRRGPGRAGTAASRRAAEWAARSLLGHLRTAVEQATPENAERLIGPSN